MGALVDLSGQRFGLLTVVRRADPNSTSSSAHWLAVVIVATKCGAVIETSEGSSPNLISCREANQGY